MSYAFSPITSKQQFEEALAYIVREAARLSKNLTGTSLQLKNAKVFAHYPEEYRFLEQLILEYGTPANIGRSTSLYVDCNLMIEGAHLENIGIRRPDPYRSHVGCGDYIVTDAAQFVALASSDKQSYVRPFPEMHETFIALWHPVYDVLCFIHLS